MKILSLKYTILHSNAIPSIHSSQDHSTGKNVVLVYLDHHLTTIHCPTYCITDFIQPTIFAVISYFEHIKQKIKDPIFALQFWAHLSYFAVVTSKHLREWLFHSRTGVGVGVGNSSGVGGGVGMGVGANNLSGVDSGVGVIF
jgi:hypothetical protein